MRRLLFVIGLVILWIPIVAASPASQSTALAICGVVGIILPFVLKLVPAAGHYMVLIALVVSFLVAAGAELITGELVLSRLQDADAATLFVNFMSVWGLSQVVYATLTQSTKTSGSVT